MTDETKKLIESVTTNCNKTVCVDFKDYVLKSEFIRVVEDLTKQIELADEKALRFAEFTNQSRFTFDINDNEWYGSIDGGWKKDLTTSELYTSKAFEDYLQSLKK